MAHHADNNKEGEIYLLMISVATCRLEIMTYKLKSMQQLVSLAWWNRVYVGWENAFAKCPN
jgi:hypothetical protein